MRFTQFLKTNPCKGTCFCERPGFQSWCKGNSQFPDRRLRRSKQELGSSSSTFALHTNLGCQKNQRWHRKIWRVIYKNKTYNFGWGYQQKMLSPSHETCWGHHGSDIVLIPLNTLQASNVGTSNPLTPKFPPMLLIWHRERFSPWIMSWINAFTWAIDKKSFS